MSAASAGGTGAVDGGDATSTADLDPLIHAPKRLRLMAILSTFDHVSFARLQERLGLTAPDLSKQLRALQDAGYVTTRRSGRGPGSRTWATMTRNGRSAYEQHVAALRAVLDGPGRDEDAGSEDLPS
jgi:DNA-binding MarR family transcriptional regulator